MFALFLISFYFILSSREQPSHIGLVPFSPFMGLPLSRHGGAIRPHAGGSISWFPPLCLLEFTCTSGQTGILCEIQIQCIKGGPPVQQHACFHPPKGWMLVTTDHSCNQPANTAQSRDEHKHSRIWLTTATAHICEVKSLFQYLLSCIRDSRDKNIQTNIFFYIRISQDDTSVFKKEEHWADGTLPPFA